MCTALELDPDNPEDASYTFGTPAKTQSGAAALVAKKYNQVVQDLYKHYTETDYTVNIHAGLLDGHDKYISEAFIALDGINAQLLLKADHKDVIEQGERLSAAEVALDGANAQIALKASQADVQKLEGDVQGVTTRLSKAEIAIDGANAAIALKASQTTVDELGERVSSAEILIDGMNSTIALKANKIDLQGYVTAAELEANVVRVVESADLSYVMANTVSSYTFDGVNASLAGWLTVGGNSVEETSLKMGTLVSANVWGAGNAIDLSHSHKVTVNDDGTITLGEVSSTGGNFKIADTKAYKDGVAAKYTEGYNLGFGNAENAYKPTSITRTGYNTANKTVTVKAANAHQDLLTGKVIDATEIYNAGWNECISGANAFACLINYYASGETLYDRDGNVAAGPWYKGTPATRYSLPAAK
jgi:hypothetical protein